MVIPTYSFTLNGAMTYSDNKYAFFYGNTVSSAKGYTVSNTINGYTIEDIANNTVTLRDSSNKVYNLKVGEGFSRTGTNQWKPLIVAEPVVLPDTSGSALGGGSAAAAPAGPVSDIMAEIDGPPRQRRRQPRRLRRRRRRHRQSRARWRPARRVSPDAGPPGSPTPDGRNLPINPPPDGAPPGNPPPAGNTP